MVIGISNFMILKNKRTETWKGIIFLIQKYIRESKINKDDIKKVLDQ